MSTFFSVSDSSGKINFKEVKTGGITKEDFKSDVSNIMRHFFLIIYLQKKVRRRNENENKLFSRAFNQSSINFYIFI